MKLPFKSVAMSTIVHSTEDEEKVKNAFKSLIPKEVEIEESKAEGHFGDSKKILSVSIQRRPHMREFWDQILKRLGEEELSWLKKRSIDRIGDDCTLYLRFSKQYLVSDKKLRFSDTGDVFHTRIKISAYPAKRDLAVEKMEEFIESEFKYG